MSNITYQKYRKEIESLAESLVEEAIYDLDSDELDAEDILDYINMSSMLHETIDGHQWVTYYAYNDDVLKHSDNRDSMAFNMGNEEMGRVVAEQGLDTLKMQMAFFAMYDDVQELISEQIELQLEELEQ